MTRFVQEITGALDREIQARGGDLRPNFWREHAEKEMWKAVEKFHKDADVDENGVATWKSNGNCLPEDILEMLDWAGVATINYERTRAERDKQNAEFLAEYREQQKNHKYTEEELFEMRAAFGKGAVIVDAITGQKIQL